MANLRRFWFEFALELSGQHPIGTLRGVGVTALDLTDALGLVQERVFSGRPLPQVVRTVEDVDVSELDPFEVRPNMSSPLKRGIWFPQGY